MIGLVMCGGKGTRMQSIEEKLLLKYKKPLIKHVIDALDDSKLFSKIVCVTSPNAPKTREFVSSLGIEIFDAKGDGYSNDLGESLSKLDEPVFVTSGDLPLLDSEIINKIINLVSIQNVWTSILVRKDFLKSLDLDSEFFVEYNGENCAYTGISIVNPVQTRKMQYVPESYVILDDKRISVNLNTRKEYDLICAT
ncbi:MAG: NTP transferase domain-containing protein [Thaumarchaeota archaeon]|nr:NTP transferase domain-containing protein [Nitrososphaerota archaeon]